MKPIKFETAKLAKECGFVDHTFNLYFNDGILKEFIFEDTYGYYGETFTISLDELKKNWNDSWGII